MGSETSGLGVGIRINNFILSHSFLFFTFLFNISFIISRITKLSTWETMVKQGYRILANQIAMISYYCCTCLLPQ